MRVTVALDPYGSLAVAATLTGQASGPPQSAGSLCCGTARSTVCRISERLTCPAPTLRLRYRCRGPREQPTRFSMPATFAYRVSLTPASW